MIVIDGQTMGTRYNVKIITPDTDKTATLKDAIERRLTGINAIMSTYDPESNLSRFNAHQGNDWVEAPHSLVTVIEAARGISEMSDGAFDVTVGPLVNLWGFGPGGPRSTEPAKEELAASRAVVGFRKLETRSTPAALRKTVSGLSADLSAIAKGYGVDQIAALIESKGFDRYLVEIGGELRVKGHNARNRPWRLGIEKPDAKGRQVQQAVNMTRGAIATSGDYRNFFKDGGRRYSHTIDPKTGRPVAHSLASVTVLADNCMTADGLATALTALGPEKAFALAEKQGLAAFFIIRTDDGFEEKASPAFEEYVQASSGT